MMSERTMQSEKVAAPLLPFTEFVMKTDTRCNLEPAYNKNGDFIGGCNYVPTDESQVSGRHGCYEYANGKAWQDIQPAHMSNETVIQAARRIGEHTRDHNLEHVRIMKHGGEPLLHSAADLEEFSESLVRTIRSLSPATNIHLSIQTNGTRLDAAKLAVLKKYDYQVGLSIDGDQEANDRHRRDRRGKSIYERVVKASTLLNENEMRWGALCVIDTNNDPNLTVESLASLHPKSISLLLPHANHSVPKPIGKMSFGEWQISAFDWYYNQNKEKFIAMPIFESYMYALLGGKSLHESVANRPVQELFIVGNGAIQRVDTLKSTEMAAVATRMNVANNTLDEVAEHDPGIRARRLGHAGLSQECVVCPLVEAGCGGGYYPHRFKAGNHKLKIDDTIDVYAEAFRNPTIYCKENKELIPHIAQVIESDMQLPHGTLIKTLNSGIAFES